MISSFVFLCLMSVSHLCAMVMRFEEIDHGASWGQKMLPSDHVMRRASSQTFVPQNPLKDFQKYRSVPVLKGERAQSLSFFGPQVHVFDLSLAL